MPPPKRWWRAKHLKVLQAGARQTLVSDNWWGRSRHREAAALTESAGRRDYLSKSHRNEILGSDLVR